MGSVFLAMMPKLVNILWATVWRCSHYELSQKTGVILKLAVLSNKPEESTKEMVAELLAKWRFYPVAGARPLVPKKPDPTLAIEISQQLRVPADKFLYLGDTGTDMKTARGAGMFPVGALWGFRTAEELKDTGAKVLVEHPSEVLQFL
jgi:phosphoglycolate phosphatase